jgi:hypothetical protein
MPGLAGTRQVVWGHGLGHLIDATTLDHPTIGSGSARTSKLAQ